MGYLLWSWLKVTAFVITCVLQLPEVVSDVSCRDMKNNPVDWFIVYKMHGGYEFYYTDVNNPSWISGGVAITSDKQAVGYTLQQVYKPTQELLYLMYNDEHPDGHKTSAYGHTKGVLASDQTSGYWLVHSVPHFPNPANTSYGYPEQGRIYGQTLFCVTLTFEQMNTVGELYTYNHPSVYDHNIPSAMAGDVPNLVAVAEDHYHVKSAPWNVTRVLTSADGQSFQAFAKYNNFDADPYAAWLAPYYESDLLVETWQSGRGRLDSNCSGSYKVYNNKDVSISGEKFRETQDHSKWTVTVDPHVGITCIGDINREEAQLQRGGGTVCMNIPQVYNLFKKSVVDYEDCSSDLLVYLSNIL